MTKYFIQMSEKERNGDGSLGKALVFYAQGAEFNLQYLSKNAKHLESQLLGDTHKWIPELT